MDPIGSCETSLFGNELRVRITANGGTAYIRQYSPSDY